MFKKSMFQSGLLCAESVLFALQRGVTIIANVVETNICASTKDALRITTLVVEERWDFYKTNVKSSSHATSSGFGACYKIFLHQIFFFF